jgi:hypothetical protein
VFTIGLFGRLASAQTISPESSPRVLIDNQLFQVIDRVAIDDAEAFKGVESAGNSARPINLGSVPPGDLGDGGVGCVERKPAAKEAVEQTFARLPGERSPSLFAAIAGLHLSANGKGGRLEIALFNPCGPWIAVPISRNKRVGIGGSYDLNRLSLRFSAIAGTRVVQVLDLSFFGRDTVPDSYKVVGLNQAVLLTVPFKWSVASNDTEQRRELPSQVQGLELVGWYDSGAYSAQNHTYRQITRPYRVPSQQQPFPVKWNK